VKLYYDNSIGKGQVSMIYFIDSASVIADECSFVGWRLLAFLQALKEVKAEAVLVSHRGYTHHQHRGPLPGQHSPQDEFILAATLISDESRLDKRHKGEPPAWLYHAFWHNTIPTVALATWEEYLRDSGWVIKRREEDEHIHTTNVG